MDLWFLFFFCCIFRDNKLRAFFFKQKTTQAFIYLLVDMMNKHGSILIFSLHTKYQPWTRHSLWMAAQGRSMLISDGRRAGGLCCPAFYCALVDMSVVRFGESGNECHMLYKGPRTNCFGWWAKSHLLHTTQITSIFCFNTVQPRLPN